VSGRESSFRLDATPSLRYIDISVHQTPYTSQEQGSRFGYVQ